MKKEKVFEVATYCFVASIFFLLSPWIANMIDRKLFNTNSFLQAPVSVMILGIVIVSVGSALALWATALFKLKGKGTPNPMLPPKNLIISGPYKFTRNPIYLGGTIVLLGESLVYFSLSLFGLSILFSLTLYLSTKFFEEPALVKRFGNSYKAYIRNVPRYFPNPFKFYL